MYVCVCAHAFVLVRHPLTRKRWQPKKKGTKYMLGAKTPREFGRRLGCCMAVLVIFLQLFRVYLKHRIEIKRAEQEAWIASVSLCEGVHMQESEREYVYVCVCVCTRVHVCMHMCMRVRMRCAMCDVRCAMCDVRVRCACGMSVNAAVDVGLGVVADVGVGVGGCVCVCMCMCVCVRMCLCSSVYYKCHNVTIHTHAYTHTHNNTHSLSHTHTCVRFFLLFHASRNMSLIGICTFQSVT